MSSSDRLALLPLAPLVGFPSPDLAAVHPWEAEPLQDVENGMAIDRQLREVDPEPEIPKSEIPIPEPPSEEPETLLGAARAQVAALLQQAEEQAEQLRRTAIREGLREGTAQAEAACAAECARLREIAEGISGALARHCEAQAPALAQLAALAAEALLMEQLSLEPERVATVVSRALGQTLAATQVTVYLHPEDLPLVQSPEGARGRGGEGAKGPTSQSPSRPLAPSPPPSVQWRPDPSLERGGCRIESDQGEVDATLSGRLTRFREAMGS